MMSGHRARPGEGTAWLVTDRPETAGCHCYWYTGPKDDHLVEHAHVTGAAEAVAWGRQRTPRVRIRTADGRASWAGSAPRPAGIAHTWIETDRVLEGESC